MARSHRIGGTRNRRFGNARIRMVFVEYYFALVYLPTAARAILRLGSIWCTLFDDCLFCLVIGVGVNFGS